MTETVPVQRWRLWVYRLAAFAVIGRAIADVLAWSTS